MGAAWSAFRKFGHSDTRYYSRHWDDPPGQLKPNSEIFCIDFSFSRAELEQLVADGHKVLVLDHHLSMQRKIADLPYVHFDLTKSGAMLSWEYFNPDYPTPKLIRAIEAGDLWEWDRYPGSKAIKAYMGRFEWNFDSWSAFAARLEDPAEEATIVHEGGILVEQQERVAKSQAKRAGEVMIGGHRVRCINATGFVSEIGNAILEAHPDIPFAATFFVDSKDHFIYSLRGRKGGIDVGELAEKHYGGGGHPMAAGFRVPALLPSIAS